MMQISLKRGRLYDKDERTLILRGVNLGGNCKIPVILPGISYAQDDLNRHNALTFVGRPFPLEDADEHFERIKSWGFNSLRYIFTWEAVEHEGPGIYDKEYLQYMYDVIEKAAEYELLVYPAMHQNAWSRFSGGAGAPRWTFEAIGMDITNFNDTDAALLYDPRDELYLPQSWRKNYTKLAAATMFTLFFGGNDFAPRIKIQNETVQDFLQRHYINTAKKVAETLRDLPNVIGYDLFGELSPGYIGWQELHKTANPYRQGIEPTPFKSMVLGEGHAQVVNSWEKGFAGKAKRRKEKIDPLGKRAWQNDSECIWRKHGVWEFDAKGKPKLLKPNYFSAIREREVNFQENYLKPFIINVSREIKLLHPEAYIIIKNETPGFCPSLNILESEDMIYSENWFDMKTLTTKKYSPLYPVISRDPVDKSFLFTTKAINESFSRQVKMIRRRGYKLLNHAPLIISETGIPFDLNEKEAYKTGDYRQQEKALNRTLKPLEENFVSYMIWHYNPNNTNQRGDQWNGEDFSIYSIDQEEHAKINTGSRTLNALIRPYALKTAGDPLYTNFDPGSGIFKYAFRHNKSINEPTVFFIPNHHYPEGYEVMVSDGRFEMDIQEQTLIYYHTDEMEIHKILIAESEAFE